MDNEVLQMVLGYVQEYLPTILAVITVLGTVLPVFSNVSNFFTNMKNQVNEMADKTEKKVNEIKNNYDIEALKGSIDALISENYTKDQKIDELIQILTRIKTKEE